MSASLSGRFVIGVLSVDIVGITGGFILSRKDDRLKWLVHKGLDAEL